ncbi:MAG: ferritin family protein [Planctomycetes bacterium]|nr:ferritin family protein [Planctomycetota bacterium]
MAEQIERNGAAYYRKAAEGAAGKQAAETLLELARMEDDHEKTFSRMKADLAGAGGAETFDQLGEGELYLQAMVAGKVFDPTAAAADELTGTESLLQILERAIDLEKDSIVFYVTMKSMVPDEAGKQRIGDIIDEEIGHIALLSKKLLALGGEA